MPGLHHVYAGPADPLFYDHPARGGTATRFAAADRAPAPGWRRHESTTWIQHTPHGRTLPDQGWKVHVSATTDDAEQVVDQVHAWCLAHDVAHKFLPSGRIHHLNNSKYARRGSSGKLLTVYPADDAELARVLHGLDALLTGRQSPYILGDLRYGTGPLYVRYGGFTEAWCTDPAGRRVLALRRPDGTLVPDERGPVFAVPDWVEPPAVLADALAVHDAAETAPLPYQVERALHFSNGGGVYLARTREPVPTPVVLREARPLAGLDGSGRDAVTRLDCEAEALAALAGIDGVPALLDRFTCWEHHYLAEEWIEGETLRQFMARNNPLTRPDPTPRQLADYTDRVLAITDHLETVLAAVHARGYAFGDLHLTNVMLRPDGRVCLVDFEIAHRPGTDPDPTMGCPGFVAPGVTGQARDRYALACIRLALFLPLTMLFDLEPAKTDQLLAAVRDSFPVPRSYLDRIREQLHAARPTTAVPTTAVPTTAVPTTAVPTTTVPPAAPAAPSTGAPAPGALARAVLASATPHRADRLHPGDPQGLLDGGTTLAHGAAGVLYALAQTGHHVPQDHLDWLWHTARTQRDPRPGLYTGLHGTALALAHLGRTDRALDLIDRAPAPADTSGDTGWAGAGLAWHQLAHATGDTALHDAARHAAHRAADLIDRHTREADPHYRPGLLNGLTGAAAFLLQRHATDPDPAHLDYAARALHHDADHTRTTPDGTVNLKDGTRLLPYLAAGSAGLALVATDYLTHRQDERLAAVVTGALRAARAPFTLYSDLFTGRAGLMLLLARHADHDPDAARALARHRANLAWHAISYQGGLAFPGEQHHRLSMDLATGTAGVLLALAAAPGRPAPLPGLAPLDRATALAA